jgi:hypothetical protein
MQDRWRGDGQPLAAQSDRRFREQRGRFGRRDGFPRSDKIDAIASSSGQLVMHGIDGPFSWQMLIHDGSEIAALSFASSDATISAFGTCKQ